MKFVIANNQVGYKIKLPEVETPRRILIKPTK